MFKGSRHWTIYYVRLASVKAGMLYVFFLVSEGGGAAHLARNSIGLHAPHDANDT